MKRFALLMIPALAFAACATAKPVPTGATLAKIEAQAPAATPAPTPTPKPPSDMTGLTIGFDGAPGWEASFDDDGKPEEQAQSSIRHIASGALIVVFGGQSWTAKLTDMAQALETGILGPNDRIVTSRGDNAGPDRAEPTIVWMKWTGLDSEQHPIMGEFYIRRLPAPHDDLIVTIGGIWKSSEELQADFDLVCNTVKVEPANHRSGSDVPTQRF